jgi:hypothetical protein
VIGIRKANSAKDGMVKRTPVNPYTGFSSLLHRHATRANGNESANPIPTAIAVSSTCCARAEPISPQWCLTQRQSIHGWELPDIGAPDSGRTLGC